MKYIVIEYINGVPSTYIGPFASHDEAMDYEDYMRSSIIGHAIGGDFRVVALQSPAPMPEAFHAQS